MKRLNPGDFGRCRGAGTIVVSLIAILLSGLTAAWLGAVGTTRYVDDNTCPATGSGTLANPYCRIQDAICAAMSGDTVSVAPGTYPESLRMKPGVSVMSQNGAAVTTINGAGQPCTDTNYCTKRAGNQCSVVLFGSGHTTATHLEGFTLTGGAGLIQTSPAQVAGGGIFVFSSPTIANNVITNNVLSGPQREYNGAGVYVALGAPVISNNTITGNRAVPAAGTSGNFSYGYGGGIWVGFYSDPTITHNVITGNRAGDPNLAYSIGSGGAIVVWPSDPNHTGPRVDGNLMADNVTDSLGGGIALNSLLNTGALAVVTNNVIVGNSAKNGGGAYIYFNSTNLVNNTISGNTAFLGGGIYSGQNDVTLPVNITNNIIEGNRLEQFGNGGGLYTLDLSATFDPVISNNDFWGNDRNQVAGDKTDATVIGSNGNFLADPRFVNRSARDFHLDPNSPAIDRASATLAPAVDRDGAPRGVDGNGIPNNPMPGDDDVGAYEKQQACLPAPEVCDGLDNNCNSLIDEGFTDTDLDGQADCVDPDDDNDTVADASDCAPLDATAFGAPTEVSGLDVTGAAPTSVTFSTQNIGSGTRYEILAGLVSRLSATGGFQEDFCLAASLSGGAWQDTRPAPRPGDAWFYLARSFNACGRGTLGSGAADAPGAGDVCPAGVVDQDADGSPSDLDCNDASAAQSPNNVEICDNIDNNCDQSVDEGNPGGGQTCGSNVGTCQFGSTVCTGGSIACTGGVGPGPEFCDGLDNDCDGIADNNVVDTDGDGLDDCADTDDDNDGVLDTADCAPLDATAFGVPVEVQNLDALPGPPVTIVWTDQSIGSGTRYDVASGQIAATGAIDFGLGVCLPGAAASPATDTRSGPPPDTVWYYLVKSRNACGPGTYGSAARDAQPVCP